MHRLRQACFAFFHPEKHGESRSQEIPCAHAAQLLQVPVGHDGMAFLERVAKLGRLVQDVPLPPDVIVEGHDQIFANGVDGGIRDLREHLLEVVKEQLRFVGKTGEGCVRPHRPYGLLTLCRHGNQNGLQIFVCISEGPLPHQDGGVVGRLDAGWIGQVLQRNLVLFQPLGIGLARGQLLFDLLVGDNAAFLRIHQKHAARLEPALAGDLRRVNRQHPRLGCHDDQAAMGHHESPGAQSIAVKLGSDHPAIRKSHGGRTIPGLHQRGMVFIESLDVIRHRGIARPGRGNQHLHDVRQAAPGQEQEFHRVVKVRRIASARSNNGLELLHVVAEQGGSQDGGPRVHPVNVATQRIDFSIMTDVAIGVGKIPGGEGVRGEALVNETQGAPDFRIGQLPVEVRDLRCEQQTLVNDRASGEGGNVEEALLPQIGLANCVFSALADDVELALQEIRVHLVGPFDENLLNVRLGAARQAPNRVGIHRCVAPAQYCQAFVTHNLFQDGLTLHAFVRLNRKKNHSHAILARGRKRET